MRSLVRSSAAIAVAALLLAGCEGNITGPPSSEIEITESAAVSQESCAITVVDGESIQEAVDEANPGDHVCVDGGTYEEQVVITKDLTLSGNDATIKYPDDADWYAIVESQGSTWQPIIFAYGGTAEEETDNQDNEYKEVSGTETIDVSVSGFTIDGRGEQPEAQRKVGIFFRNVQSTGAIANNTVENMGVGGVETFGILAYGDTRVAITDNTVSEYERGGIGANGDDGEHPDPDVTIADNEVTGDGEPGRSWGPNGIQIGYGATGQITNNVVKDNRHGDDYTSATSAGIIVFGSSNVMVQGNQVTNSDIALATAAAESNEFVKNEVHDAIIGAFLFGVDNNKLVNNLLSDSEGGPEGVVGVLNVGENNKLINNTIDGFETPVGDFGTDSKVQANSP